MEEVKGLKELKEILKTNKDILEAYTEVKKDLISIINISPQKVRGIDYSIPTVQSSNVISMETYIMQYGEQLKRVDKQIEVIINKIDKLEKYIAKIERRLKKLTGLEYKVAYLKEVEGLTLKEIAEELNYSYQHIRRVYAKSMW